MSGIAEDIRDSLLEYQLGANGMATVSPELIFSVDQPAVDHIRPGVRADCESQGERFRDTSDSELFLEHRSDALHSRLTPTKPHA